MRPMTRAIIAAVAVLGLTSMTSSAAAQQLPATGDLLPITGGAGWPPKLEWLYDVPSPTDAAGKIVVFWFCAPKQPACTDDLARVVTLREHGRVYVIAYVNGNKKEALKLDPIRESEGVGRGTVAYAGTRASVKSLGALFKSMGITGPASIVVGVDGKVAHVTTSPAPNDLDARDAAVAKLAASIKEYTTSSEGPKVVKPGETFTMGITIQLASWLKYGASSGWEFKLMAPNDLKCDHKALKGEQLQVAGQALTARVQCSGPKGSYEARGSLSFGYDAPGGAAGLGTESANWRFEIKD